MWGGKLFQTLLSTHHFKKSELPGLDMNIIQKLMNVECRVDELYLSIIYKLNYKFKDCILLQDSTFETLNMNTLCFVCCRTSKI